MNQTNRTTSVNAPLYDRFHQKNQKRPEEKLQSLKAFPELASLINTAEAEQVNRELSSSRYSLCQMRDTHYMFSLRLYFHLHNARKNSAFLKEMQKRTDENIHLGLHGKLVCGQKETLTRPTEHQGRDPHVPAKVDSVPEEGNKFSVAMFPIDQRHKVFDMTKHIRVYDNTSQYLTIHNRDMEILKDAFRNIASLDDWTVSSPQQWQRDDGRNCGVFVCTNAKMSLVHHPLDVRKDMIAHFPVKTKRGRCRHCNNGYTNTLCSKCNVRLCFSDEQICLRDYHCKTQTSFKPN
ncbi:hypothetical protein DPX16_20678 [Anabarilius grahami]|uniref:Uncharacterized protein n=1 Tax=Anabarilius grahami TaxID=495550 RepID=A0A3N0YLG0_ANAGA|nr:hypothetical protein DPX16_20678 [Anabarilius grahami]